MFEIGGTMDENRPSSECSSSLMSDGKPTEFRPQVDPPPAYSHCLSCTTRSAKQGWNRTIAISAAAAGISVLFVCLLVGGLVARIHFLNGLLAGQSALVDGQKAENERLLGLCGFKKSETERRNEAAVVELEECRGQVTNLTEKLDKEEQWSRTAVERWSRP
ncbi:hypothetical protein M3Y99_00284600 [Aphelenchoides fujianensis]|nr:hypothetical protein M3Y99_00284600 [Aphelenchoides fujianensis]